MAQNSFPTKVRLTLFILVWVIIEETLFVDGAKKKRNSRKGRAKYSSDGPNYGTSIKFLFWVIGMLFVPVLITFAYSVAKDPLTPKVVRALWEQIKARTTGYLSGDKGTRQE